METIRVRCRSCGKDLESAAGKSVCCGCSNMTTIKGDVISANYMSAVIMLTSYSSKKKNEGLTDQDLEWQNQRRKRKIRKLDFEVR